METEVIQRLKELKTALIKKGKITDEEVSVSKYQNKGDTGCEGAIEDVRIEGDAACRKK